MKWFLTLLLAWGMSNGNAQVGIGTTTPASTLHVVGLPGNATAADGVTFPSLTGDQLKAKDAAYSTAQAGAVVYVTGAVTTASTKTTNVTSPGFYYFDGSLWQWLRKITTGQLLNCVFIDDPTLVNSSISSTSYVDVISYTYTPVSSSSKIFVEYHNNNYTIGGNTGSSTDQFKSQLLINGSSITSNTQTMEIYGSANTAFRTGTLFPIVAVATNTSTASITIKVQVQRSSGDDAITFNGTNGTLIIQEISN